VARRIDRPGRWGAAWCALLLALAITRVAVGQERASLEGHRAGVYYLAFSPDGRTLATSSDSLAARVRLWEVVTGKELKPFREELCGGPVSFSPDGKTLASVGQVVVKGESLPKRTVRLWDVATRTVRLGLPPGPHGIAGIAFTPDGQALITGRSD